MTGAVGFGVATTAGAKILDVRFLSAAFPADAGVTAPAGHRLLNGDEAIELLARVQAPAHRRALEAMAALPRPHPLAGQELHPVLAAFDDAADPPATAAEAYLRLHLLSLRLAPPRSLNLDGIFALLNTNVWTTDGVVDRDRFEDVQRGLAATGRPLSVVLQDKVPRLLDYVSPEGVRIANPNTVRLGAHLAPGTTVMSAGAVNVNAGTLGPAMIEGRVSAGVVVGARSDVGGGASLMGTLSGGNQVAVSVGEDCLLEAMAGLGIPVGDRVRIEAGFYVKSTTPVSVADAPEFHANPVAARHAGQVVKAIALAGIDDAVFRRNARTGTPEVVPRGGRVWGSLNPQLH